MNLSLPGCGLINICDLGDLEGIPRYRKFLQGYMAAFLNVYAQGSPEYLPAVSVRENLEEHVGLAIFEADVDC